MLEKLRKTLWGHLSKEEFERFSFLALILLFIIGSYWLMRPIKDGIFISIVGKGYLTWVKIFSFVFLFPLLLGYAKLITLLNKQKLFYVLCSGYAVIFLIISYLLTHQTIGIANTHASPGRLLGWGTYVAIESFGALLASLFWSFVARVTHMEEAEKGFGIIILGAQLGSIVGPAIAICAPTLGIATLTLFVSFNLIIIPLLVKIFTRQFPTEHSIHHKEESHKTSTFEGLRLLFSNNYLLGILGISMFSDTIETILELQMNFLAANTFSGVEQLTSFFGIFGVSTNIATFLFALLGTSFFIRNLGLTFCLVAYPLGILLAVTLMLSYSYIWLFCAAMVIVKTLNYALNVPCEEIMYHPTSRDIQFKAKSIIDLIGGRSSRAVGAGIVQITSKTLAPIFYNSIACFVLIGIWISASFYVGKANKELVDTNKIIE